jgi:hypothetical protein
VLEAVALRDIVGVDDVDAHGDDLQRERVAVRRRRARAGGGKDVRQMAKRGVNAPGRRRH